MERRKVIKNLALGSLILPSGIGAFASVKSQNTIPEIKDLKGNINHSVCRWTFDQLSIEELCLLVKKIGFSAIDLVEPKDFPTLKKHGIDSSMCTGAHISLTEGWNDVKNHPILISNYLKYIDLVADAGYKNLICFSGNRNGMSEEIGLKNCVIGLKQIMDKAEKRGVIIQMELFNSKVNHPDYMADSSRWGIELCKALGSENFKLLYDIYHMQIMEGDIIHTIQEHNHYFGHYHTAGVPGRHEIDETQELHYPAIMRAILATGYKGYVAQEFIATAKNKDKALETAIKICDI
ncbi:TIM barrel protein [Flavobacterium sp. SUN052]|uniref:hydroxypyruvate isomerase family protein n=1 Tax=Flavobacterium sp. SUN052 TaxID=3002441 RepID=UPI00237E819F|nr:TIM barrel protein [Flavobacterium sp. SUN052]MEC4003749.1 TIM barrel protein [Flavobacterium sp. SUN052]